MKKFFFSVFTFVFFVGSFAPSLVSAQIPNDPKVKQWAFNDIGAYKAWDLTTGSRNVVVAVIDNGFDANHPDLKDNVWKNSKEIPNNNIDDDKNGYIDDVQGWNFVRVDLNGDGKIRGDEKLGNNNPIPNVAGLSDKEKEQGYFNHATLVAGLIGAVGNNKRGMAGLNWSIRLMNVKVLDNTGAGDYTPLSEAILYAVNNGAHIINISAVGTDSKDLETSIDYANAHGVAVIAAAGNNSASLDDSPLYPACSDVGDKTQKVLGVSAIDESHRLANFSNFGSDCVDITAPGVRMGSLVRYEPSEGLKLEFSDGWNGTSFATPLVSGAAALIKAVQPDWQVPQIYEALLKSTHKTPPKDEAVYKSLFGAGLLQVDKAVQYAIDRLPITRPLASLDIFDPTTGIFESLGTDTKISTSTQISLRKISLLKVFRDAGETKYLAMRTFFGNQQITIYSKNLEKLHRFEVPSSVKGQIFVDTFLNNKDAQIVFVPEVDTDPVTVFSLAGKKLSEKFIDVHGSSLITVNLLANKKNAAKNLVVISRENGKSFLQVFDNTFTQKQDIALSSFGTIRQIDMGDLDGDTKMEYVTMSQKGANATISVIDGKGKLIRQFPVSNTAPAEDIRIILGDFNNDKKEDIITFEKGMNEFILWKSTGEILKHLPLLPNLNQENFLLPIYK